MKLIKLPYYGYVIESVNSTAYLSPAEVYFTGFEPGTGLPQGVKYKERKVETEANHIFYELPMNEIRNGNLKVKDLKGKLAYILNGRTPNPEKVKILQGADALVLHDDVFTFLEEQGLKDLYYEVPIIIFNKKNQEILKEFNRGLIAKNLCMFVENKDGKFWEVEDKFDDRISGSVAIGSIYCNKFIAEKLLEKKFGNIQIRKISQ